MSKKHDDDDGRVIANMNTEGFRWYRKNLDTEGEPATLTKGEKIAMLKAAILTALVVVGTVLGMLGVIYLVILAWLS